MALARELQKSDSLLGVVSGFPAFALKRERIDPSLLVTAPFYQTLHFGLRRCGLLVRSWSNLCRAYANQAQQMRARKQTNK
jgi:hypothetical protein